MADCEVKFFRVNTRAHSCEASYSFNLRTFYSRRSCGIPSVWSLHTERQRRPATDPSKRPASSSGRCNDARGIAEPLERYGELLTCQIMASITRYTACPPRARHTLARLKQLFHESEGLPTTSKILLRPDYQWRYGYNHQTIYRRAAGTGRFLLPTASSIRTTLRWANTTRIVQITDDPWQAAVRP